MKHNKNLSVVLNLLVWASLLLGACHPSVPTITQTSPSPQPTPDKAYLNATYQIDGQPVSLVDGKNETVAAPGSASKIITQVVGAQAFGDINNDGKEDAALFLSQDGSGSGTFYYVAIALQTENGYQGSNAILLGDRIVVQTIAINDHMVNVQYKDRRPDEPMSADPTQIVNHTYQWSDGTLQEVN